MKSNRTSTLPAAEYYCHVACGSPEVKKVHQSLGHDIPMLDGVGLSCPPFSEPLGVSRDQLLDASAKLWVDSMLEASGAGATRFHSFKASKAPGKSGTLRCELMLPNSTEGIEILLPVLEWEPGVYLSTLAHYCALKIVGAASFAQLQAERLMDLCATEESKALEARNLSFPPAWLAFSERAQLGSLVPQTSAKSAPKRM
jgi:hypothetical protein